MNWFLTTFKMAQSPHTSTRGFPGFTLVEVLVVISLMVMVLLTITSLFFTTLVGTSKNSSSAQVKEEGDFALGQIEFLLRNAVALRENSTAGDGSGAICQTGMTQIRLESFDSGQTLLFKEADGNGDEHIASNSGVYLTSADVELISGPIFSCSESSDGTGKFVTVDFTLQKGTPGVDQVRDIVTQDFSTSVVVRGAF